ncbi:tripartite tricarboxylate transporter TctB family protein [Mesobacterium pallidum]|uniref:tripartite tricarboxylate transporter TctB family protein n=1 Tax=Mesobacterium pallidum TaxID=2872037 RepID=UPI001EE1A80F|nr:tripartite tricarboxylate transporter TctB family protein [Mesobacterium pallidum]
MNITPRQVEWLVIALLVGLVALVFQQAATDMAAQGIAPGGPYDNAAAYPKTVAVVLGLLIAAQAAVQLFGAAPPQDEDGGVPLRKLVRPAALIFIFGLYLGTLPLLGYHVATPLMLGALMVLCGLRRPLAIALPALLVSFGAAYVFEAWLKIVLPGGLFHLNMVW